jgi:hypothetical protein
LVFISSGDTEEPVQSWAISELKENSPDAIASLVLETCQDDCDQREHSCRYSLRAAEKEVLAATVIKCSPSESRDPLEVGSSAGSGAMAQLVRMNEAMLRAHIQSFGILMSGYKALLENQQGEINSLRRREQVAAEIIQQAASNALSIDVDEGQKGVAIARLADFAEKLAPIILEKFSGQSGGPIPVV